MNQATFTALVLDEMADLALYRKYHHLVRHKKELHGLFDTLITTEEKHVAFWQSKTKVPPAQLDIERRVKVWLLTLFGRVFGVAGILLVLEAIEVQGVRKYIAFWESLPDGKLRADVRHVLEDELNHEDFLVTAVTGRTVRPDSVRNAFLGFNDGSVEILGAVSGFAAAFGEVSHILIAGFTVAFAGAVSMGIGAFMATNAEHEVSKLDEGRRRFLKIKAPPEQKTSSAVVAGLLVGGTYLVGALVPVVPFLFGARSPLPSILLSGILILLVSAALAFLSGMRIVHRLLLNGGLITLAVIASTLLGKILEVLR